MNKIAVIFVVMEMDYGNGPNPSPIEALIPY
jgi:hypothetical protein